MDSTDKKRLAMTGDMSRAACATRLRAAITLTGMTQTEIAAQINRKASSITNQIKGDQFPSRELMNYLYEEHRVDFNFMMAGSHNQLPGDVAEKLFEILASST